MTSLRLGILLCLGGISSQPAEIAQTTVRVRLFSIEQPSPIAKGPGQDPTRPHVAFAVADIVATRAELDRLGVSYWTIEALTSPDSVQLFLNDPCGNMVELHQIDKCRCRASNRPAS